MQVIVLNGASSPGKTSIARALQAALPEPWLTVGIDTSIRALNGRGLEIDAAGHVAVSTEFGEVEFAWMRGVAAMAAVGAHVIVDDVRGCSGRAT